MGGNTGQGLIPGKDMDFLMKKKVISVLSSFLLLAGLLSASVTSAAAPKQETGPLYSVTPGKSLSITGTQVVAENEALSLSYDADDIALLVTDKATGQVWSSSVDQETVENIRTSTLFKERMTSLIALKYVNDKDAGYIQDVKTTTLKTEKDFLEIETLSIEKGIRIDMTFTKLGFRILLDAFLDGNALVVDIPADGVTETKNRGLTAIEIMPFMGAALPEEEGYILYPDGSGAIHRFSDAADLPSTALRTYTFEIYGDNEVEVHQQGDTWNSGNTAENQVAYLPCFGVQKDGGAFIASIEAGESDAAVLVAPAGAQVGMARVNPSFTVRRLYDPLRSKIGANGAASGTGDSKVKKIDKDPIQAERAVRYTFLNGDDANYSGMAAAYRQQLQEQKKLASSPLLEKGLPMVVDLFMGTMEESFPFDKFVKMTDFEDAEAIMQSLLDMGVDNLTLNLLGWNADGYGKWPQPFKAEGSLGGRKGLNSLLEAAGSRHVQVLLNLNMMDRKTGFFKWNVGNESVRDGNNTPITNYLEDIYLYNSVTALNRLAKNSSKLPAAAGISFEQLGKMIYHDYNTKNPTSRGDTAANWRQMMESAADQNRLVASYGGNQYVLSSCDLLMDIPSRDSGYFLSSETVPFFQMVVHGAVPYVGAPINLLGNRTEYLRQIEYGYVPYYRLTQESSDELMFTRHNYLYASQFSDLEKQIADNYEELKPLASLAGLTMVRHERLAEDVYQTVYEDGTLVVVNYGDGRYAENGLDVEPQNFQMIKEGWAL